jgi:hypothetical protein
MTEIAKRAVACKGWRWMPGMLTLDGRRVVGVDGDVLVLHYADEHKCYQRWTEDAEPDLGDPATVGCLRELVKAAWSSEYVFTLYSTDRASWIVKHGKMLVEAGTEVEALVAALEAAP